MFCGKCGNKLNDGDIFCGVCGNRIQPVEPAPIVEELVIEEPVEPASAVEEPVIEEPVEPAPAVEEPVIEESVESTPIIEEPVIEEPVEPAPVEELVTEQPVSSGPIVNIVGEPIIEQPTAQQISNESEIQVSNENYGDTYNQPPVKKQKKVRQLKKTSIGIKILSIFLCLFMFSFAFSTTLVCITRSLLSEECLTNVLEDFEVSDINLVDENGNQVTLTDIIYNTIKDETKELFGITKKDVSSYLSSRDVNNFVEDIIMDYADFFLTGDKLEKLTADEVIDFIQDNQRDIERKLGYTFTQDDFDFIENEFESGSLRYVNFAEIANNGINVALLSLPFSILSLVLNAVIAVGLWVLILVANGRSIRLWFAYSGMTFLILGLILLLSSIGGYVIMLINIIPVLNALITPLCLQLLIYGGSFFGAGLIMFVISRIITKKQKKAMKQMQQA